MSLRVTILFNSMHAGEMSATVMRYPEQYHAMIEPLRRTIEGSRSGLPQSAVKIGLSMNFNKLDDASSATVTTCKLSAHSLHVYHILTAHICPKMQCDIACHFRSSAAYVIHSSAMKVKVNKLLGMPSPQMSSHDP